MSPGQHGQRPARIGASGAKVVVMDATDPAQIDAVVRWAKPDAVIHQLSSWPAAPSRAMHGYGRSAPPTSAPRRRRTRYR